MTRKWRLPMKNLVIKGLIAFILAFLTISTVTLTADATSDSRFFGTYCGDHEEHYTIRVWCCFGGHWFVAREEDRILRFAITSHADYGESPRGDGLVSGKGTAVGEGRTIPFVFSGIVTERGHLRGSGIAPGWDPSNASANLSEDGNTVTLRGLDRTLILRKDQCGNSAPTATISSPEGGDFAWGQLVAFSGRATDPEDASFPPERLVWTSSRDGRLGTGLSIWRNHLSPGRHTIAFSATDSGGRTATDSVVINILNNPPNVPTIEEPSSGAIFYSGQEIAFRARATDREDGYLSGGSLVWRSDRSGRLGTGDLLRRTLSDIGDHMITLTAADRTGETNTASVRITVRSRPAGNTPPTVTVTSPSNYYAMADYSCVTLIAEALDLEDGRLRGSALVWSDQYHDGITMRRRDLGTGERIDLCNPAAPVGDTRHTISVTARDSGGLSSTNSIVIISIPGGLI
jgi:hypothetical protein